MHVQPYGLPYVAPDDEGAPLALKLAPLGALAVMATTYKRVFTPSYGLRPMQSLQTVGGKRQVVYWLGVLGLAWSIKKLYDAGFYDTLGDGWGFGYGGLSKKMARITKKIDRLQKRLGKKEGRGRSKAVARLQRRIDKLQAKLNAMSGQAAGQGIPGYPGDPGVMPDPMMMDPMLDAGVYDEPSGLPSWALPAALGGGLLLVLGVVMLSGGRE